MAYIGNQPTLGQYRKLDDISGSFNGSLTAFTMQVGSTNVSAGSAFQLLISLGGVIQNPGTDFTVSASTITFTTAPAASLSFFGILMGQPLNAPTPGDGTITAAKIADGTISGVKLAAAFNYDSGLLFLDDTNNRVGMGTTSPSTRLHVSDTDGAITIEGTRGTGATHNITTGGVNSQNLILNVNDDLFLDANDIVFRSASDSEYARIDSSGRLLVGTSSSSAQITALFQGNSGGSTSWGALNLARGTTSPTSGQSLGELSFSDSGHDIAGLIACQRDGGTWTSGTSQPTRLVFSTTNDGSSNPTERMRIKGNGQFDYFSETQVNLLTARGAAADAAFVVHKNATSIAFGTVVCIIRADGDLENTNNRYTGISDLKLKENIVDANSQWDDIKTLKVRNYNFKPDTDYGTHTQIGLIAQEVETVSPGLVKETNDQNGGTTKTVAYSVLYMKAVKALQEAMERIETLEAKVSALEAN